MREQGEIQTAIAELLQHCATEGLRLPPEAAAQFEKYVALLLLWNERISLTGAKTAEEISLHHIFDSLHVLPLLAEGQRVTDVGSGAGFPGIPLAIARPDCGFALIEPRRKRANFLRHCTRELGLVWVHVEEARVEDLQARLESAFDVVLSRALADLATFVRLAAPLVAPTGKLVAMKGPHPEPELRDIPEGFKVLEVRRYQLPRQWGERTLVVLERAPEGSIERQHEARSRGPKVHS
ncbi:MAG: 16S rRNA (guanine(527)-N(7))-methyltransferase RsmG [Candidatus Binatia bacterium]|nr:16S rRNA (guanine(527)-N(7))-methyltransferase RsmG [Candidatus Binatia bacterium]